MSNEQTVWLKDSILNDLEPIIEKYKALLSHLNSEENEMAEELQEMLNDLKERLYA